MINNQLVHGENETFMDRIKRESKGFNLLDPEFVEKEKREQVGYLIKTVKALGRPLTENELRELGNIL